MAATLFAGVHIWLNYALSSGRNAYVYVMAGVLALQGVGMYLFGRESLVGMAAAMIAAGLLGNIGGYLTTWSPAPSVPVAGPAVPAPAVADQPAMEG